MPYILKAEQLETRNNKVSVLDESVTNDQYPSAKAVMDALDKISVSGGNDSSDIESSSHNIESYKVVETLPISQADINPSTMYLLKEDGGYNSFVFADFKKVKTPEPKDVWDGKTLTAPVDSDGDGIYEITSGEELAYVVKNGGTMDEKTACSFILTKDIYLNDVSKVNWTTGEALNGYVPNKWFENGNCLVFKDGIIDGNGHTIYGMYWGDNPDSYETHPNAVALIPRLTEGKSLTIKNLGMDYVYVNYKNATAAFIGNTMGGNTIDISNSYVGENVTLKGGTAAAFRGYTYGGKSSVSVTLTNCYSLASMISDNGTGLLATQNDYNQGEKVVRFTNCYNANGPLNSGNNFGIVATATNCYATIIGGTGTQLSEGVKVLAAQQMQGLDVLNEKGAMSTLNSKDECWVATDTYPVLKVYTYGWVKTNNGSDFIVEQGKNDIWTYRKWCSGAIECWLKNTLIDFSSGSFTDSTGIVDSSGNNLIFKWVDISLPFTFSGLPMVTGSAQWKTTEWFACQPTSSGLIRLRWLGVPSSFKAEPANQLKVSLYVKGRWK